MINIKRPNCQKESKLVEPKIYKSLFVGGRASTDSISSLWYTMAYIDPFCHVLYIKCLSMDPVSYHYKHIGEILWSSNISSVMDIYDFHGHLYSTNFSCILVSTEKGKMKTLKQPFNNFLTRFFYVNTWLKNHLIKHLITLTEFRRKIYLINPKHT